MRERASFGISLPYFVKLGNALERANPACSFKQETLQERPVWARERFGTIMQRETADGRYKTSRKDMDT
jgi:hypothetical protein